MLEGLHFQQPYWLIGLIIPLWLYFKRGRQLALPELVRATRIRYPALGLLHSDDAEKNSSLAVNRSDITLPVLLTLLILSLAQPARLGALLPPEQSPEPVDLILVVNTGVSMVLRDYIIEGEQIDRMEMTRRLLNKLVDNFNGQRLALVVLGRPPSLWLPLTSDRRVVKDAVSRLQTTLGGRSSDLAETLTLVHKQFAPGGASDGNQRIVLLLNDAYAQLGASAPEIALQQLSADGFRLHTLAIGTTQTPDFSLGRGTLIYQPVDLQLMSRLAVLGGGEMLHATDLSVIDPLISKLEPSATQKIAVEECRLIIALYHYPLTLALILLFYRLLSAAKMTSSGRAAR